MNDNPCTKMGGHEIALEARQHRSPQHLCRVTERAELGEQDRQNTVVAISQAKGAVTRIKSATDTLSACH